MFFGNRFTLFLLFISFTFSLVSQEERSQYKLCPNAYDDGKCCDIRAGVSLNTSYFACCSGSLKVLGWYLSHQSCKQACSPTGMCRELWFPIDCKMPCFTATAWGTTLAIFGGVATIASVIAPCINEHGCNVLRKVKIPSNMVQEMHEYPSESTVSNDNETLGGSDDN